MTKPDTKIKNRAEHKPSAKAKPIENVDHSNQWPR
jgi:hypothetical protein